MSRKMKFRSFSTLDRSDVKSEFSDREMGEDESKVMDSLENHPSKSASEGQSNRLKDAVPHGKKVWMLIMPMLVPPLTNIYVFTYV